MSSKDLNDLKTLFQQSLDHYQKILVDVTALKEGDLRAINLCMNEVKKDIAEIDEALAQKLIKETATT
jgi:ferritin